VRRLEQRRRVLALEGERRALRIVLVVGPGRARGLRQAGELPLERGRPLPGARLLRQQELARVGHVPTLAPRFDLSHG
jgi:hypothetical protein